MQELIESLNELFKQDKEKIGLFLKTQGFKCWGDVKKADVKIITQLKEKLTQMGKVSYIVIEDKNYIITRPKKPRLVSEISFSIKG